MKFYKRGFNLAGEGISVVGKRFCILGTNWNQAEQLDVLLLFSFRLSAFTLCVVLLQSKFEFQKLLGFCLKTTDSICWNLKRKFSEKFKQVNIGISVHFFIHSMTFYERLKELQICLNRKSFTDIVLQSYVITTFSDRFFTRQLILIKLSQCRCGR